MCSKHSEPEWNIGNKNCIPLDFSDTKDLKKKNTLKKAKPKVQYPKFQNFIIFSADME